MSDKISARLLNIPVVGPGSQPLNEDELNLDFFGSPGEMPTFQPPVLPEPEEVQGLDAALDIMVAVLHGLENYSVGEPALIFDLTSLDAANLDLVNQMLNEGEVSVLCEGERQVQIQESVLTGLWRVRSITADGAVTDRIEVGDIPSIVRERAFAGAGRIDTDFSVLPEGVTNAPPILVELAEKMAEWQPGQPPHVVNLSLLPLSPEDLVFLGERLGVGPITILSRGYGNCRIGSTAKSNVWWVKYYNADDALILNTIEVIDVPEVARAAPEDLRDSAHRLREMLETYRREQ